MGSHIFEPQTVIRSLRGQTLHVPDLRDIFKDWPVQANAHQTNIIPIVEDAFDRLIKYPALREKYREANYARFVSLYYPYSGWDRIKILALYIVWLFCWDDAIDQQGTGDLSDNLIKAKAHRNNTTRVLEEVLGLASDSGCDVKCDHVNAELKTIGNELQKAYTLGQRQKFMAQMRCYIGNCDKEQSLRLSGLLPDFEAYKEIRHGTAAVWTLCALIEFSMGESIPEHIRDMVELQTIWEETSRSIWISNDILSLKKEIPVTGGTIESIVNAVPILMIEDNKSPQQAVDALLADLSISVAAFEAAAGVLEKAAGDKSRETILKYCDACRCMVTGSIQFS
nr:uncharacterized protein CTRU02_06614 [Colletotrichum truncatum]KAF6792531.1 hypothetical protein CTRU02_06614 [Colletotrichum truncatum]